MTHSDHDFIDNIFSLLGNKKSIFNIDTQFHTKFCKIVDRTVDPNHPLWRVLYNTKLDPVFVHCHRLEELLLEARECFVVSSIRGKVRVRLSVQDITENIERLRNEDMNLYGWYENLARELLYDLPTS